MPTRVGLGRAGVVTDVRSGLRVRKGRPDAIDERIHQEIVAVRAVPMPKRPHHS